MEKNVSGKKISMKSLTEENSLLKKRMKRERFITHGFYLVVIIIIIILFRNCSGESKSNFEAQLQSKNDSINLLNINIANLENRKAVLVVSNADSSGVTGRFVEAKIVPMNDLGKSSIFIADVIKRIEIKVPYLVECPPAPKTEPCPIVVIDSCKEKVCLDSLINDTVNVSLTKQYRDDVPISLVQKKILLKDFLSSSPPSLDYNNVYVEYLPNIYRQKTKNAFWSGVGLGGSSIILYGISEWLGHPVFIDGRDNSSAQRKHDLIFGLRVSSAVTAAASIIEFGRTVHFHNMEGKFIINPTKVGLVIDLDKVKPKK